MLIEVKGRNVAVTDELREYVQRRFEKVSKQVSDLATLSVELGEERGQSGPNRIVAEASLQLKGTTLRCSESGPDPKHAINLIADDMSRQVKRHRDKRRNRREARTIAAAPATPVAEGPDTLPAS